MADPEHLKILKQGVEAWNEWRQEFPETVPNLFEANLSEMELAGLNLTSANLARAALFGTVLTGAQLGKANLSAAGLGNADLSRANLSDAQLRHAQLINAEFKRANLSGANLVWADFSAADLTRADLSGADLRQAVIREAYMEGANLKAATMGFTIFAKMDLSKVIGLETCNHENPNYLDTHSLELSGPLPEVFLRGCGLPDRLIEYLPSIFEHPIQLYSCFISFTEADDEFAQRLYNDLQGKGVRCWRWKEDAKGGKSLTGQIDMAVRLHDKLIAVCSENSLKSSPMIREIERALQREDRLVADGQAPEVLFPIRLDNTIFGWKHPRAADVREKFIPDFTNWKDHDSYQKAFDRLLRDLRPEGQR